MREMAHADKVVASSAAINAFNTLKKQKDLSDAKFPTWQTKIQLGKNYLGYNNVQGAMKNNILCMAW